IVSRGDAEPLPQTLEWWIEWIQARPLGAKAAVLVTRAVPLLDAGKMEEAVREVVANGSLAAIDLLLGGGVVRQVVAEAELGRADRVEHPARTSFDDGRNHRSALRTTRARCTAPGFGSSRAKTPSTYGGRCTAGRSPGRSVIAQRFPAPFMVAGGGELSPTRSSYAMRGRSTPHAVASPCHCHSRGL